MAGTIYGSIRDAANNVLISDSAVVVPSYSVNCQNGSYIFVAPTTVTVVVTVSAPNYVTQEQTLTVNNGQVKQVSFALVHV